VWDGRGSPYLLHLLYAAHVILPYLVEGLVTACDAEDAALLLVGASAWNAHFPVPVDTEDLVTHSRRRCAAFERFCLAHLLAFCAACTDQPTTQPSVHRDLCCAPVPRSGAD
jgi:hypothetical protein